MDSTGTVTINLTGNAIDNRVKSEALQIIANNDLDILLKLQKLSKSIKAIKNLRDKWNLIESMFL